MKRLLRSVFPALLLSLFCIPQPGVAVSGGHGEPPPIPGQSGRPIPPGQVGDFPKWWAVNRDEFLIQLKPQEDLAEYEGKPPDSVETLLSLVGYEGHFASIVKELGVRRLKRIPKVTETLCAILRDKKRPAPERSWAAYALGDLKAHGAIDALTEMLLEKDTDLRGFSALSLCHMGEPSCLEPVVALLTNPKEDEGVRGLVALGLCGMPVPMVREALTKVAFNVRDPVPVRRACLMALGMGASDPERLLLVGACKDKDIYVAAAAAFGLGFTGKDDAVLRGIMGAKGDTNLRSYAAMSLGISASADNIEALTALVDREKDFNVRGCAALALGRTPSPKSVEALKKALWDRNASFVSGYAALALGIGKSPQALPILHEAMSSKSSSLLISCVIALAILEDPKGAPDVQKALEHRQIPEVREFAALALGRLGQSGALESLTETLQDKQSGLRHASALGLAVLGNPKACTALEPFLQDRDALVRSGAALAFDILTQDPKRPLTLGVELKGDPRGATFRRVGPIELTRELNRHLPKSYKLPIQP